MKAVSNFTEGKILGPLLKFSFPVFVALFLQTMYGAVDLFIVGRFCNNAAVSAVSTGSYVMQTLTFLITDLAMGLTILLGQKIGEKKLEEAGDVIGAGIVLFFIVALLLTIIMMFASPLWSWALQVPSEAVRDCNLYMRICSAGAVFIIAYNLLGSIFRGLGNSTIPLIIVAIACIFNIGGDLLFVAVFGMGAAGAAIATVLAQALSVILSLIIIRKMKMPFVFSLKCIRPDRYNMGQILKLGFPIALQDVLVNISFLVITSIINSMGIVASAGIGIAEKVTGFIMIVPSTFSQSMSAIIAQNAGARKFDRARKFLICGISCSLIVGIFIAYLGFFHGNLLTGIFSRDKEVVKAGWDYLKGYAIDCLFTSFLFCFIGYYNGYGKTKFVMWQGMIGAFCVRLPLSFIIHHFAPDSIFYLALATPSSTFVQIIMCFWCWFAIKKEEKEIMEDISIRR